MAQPGGASKRRYKDVLFPKKVVLLKNDNECTSFSDMNKIESKSEIEFSSSMTQNDAQKKIQETFPYLEHKRFSCAAFVKVDNDHKKFEFHGSRRVWDGKTIKKHIKGKSNLYILEEEVAQPTVTVTHDSSTGKSEEDEQDTSISSESDNKAEYVNPSSSDTGFDEVMDISFNDSSITVEPSSFSVPAGLQINPSLDAIKTEEGSFLPVCQMSDTSLLDSALEEICSDSVSDEMFDDMDLLGVVQNICPTSGSVKGGFQFQVSLTEELPDVVKSGVAYFEGVAPVMVQKLNPYTLYGIVPPSEVPGEVPVSITTDAGQQLGMTCFRYVDEMREMARQLVKDPTLQSLWFATWLQEFRFFGTDSNISQVLGPLNMQDQDSSVQTKQQQPVKVLQLLVYTAAQTDAQQFLEMIFSTSAGQIVFNSYKDRTPLPEDIARANGHEDLAQFLQDMNTRLSKETSINVQSDAIDWLELVKAVQNQSSISPDVSTKRVNPIENDDNSSDYFADAETSSCGSIDHDTGWCDISEDKGPCIRDGESIQGPTEKPEEGTPNKKPVKKWAQLDNEGDKENVSILGLAWHSFPEWLSKWRKREDTSSIQEGKDGGSTETNSASKTPKAKRSVRTGGSFIESLVTSILMLILVIMVIMLESQITVTSVTWPGDRREDRENNCKICPITIGVRNISSHFNVFNLSDRSVGEVLSCHRLVSCFTENSAKVDIEVLTDDEHDVTLLLVPMIVVIVVIVLIVLIVAVGVRFNRKVQRKEEELTPESHTSNNFQCAVTQNQHKEAIMIELGKERVRSWLARYLGHEELPSVDTGGHRNWKILAEKFELTDASRDWERVENPTEKLLTAYGEKDGSTDRNFIKASTEANMTLLASQREEKFTFNRQPEEDFY